MRILLPILSALFLILSIPYVGSAPEDFHPDTVNALLGDVSYTETFDEPITESTPEEVRIKTHLGYVVSLLKQADTSNLDASQKENRATLITLLEGYKEAGVFPKNRHFETRRPVFIDEDGNLCAVGYLIAQTEGLEAAQTINQQHKFDYIKDIDPKLVDGWLAENGLTKKEAAMIQPAYRTERTVEENNIETEYMVGSSLLAGIQIGSTAFNLLSDSPGRTNRKVSAFNTLLGLSNLTLGLVNLDNSYKETTEEDPQNPCVICYYTTTTYENPARTKLSIVNIIVGGASALFNGYRFFTTEKAEDPSKFNVSATQVYDPNSNTLALGISMSVKF